MSYLVSVMLEIQTVSLFFNHAEFVIVPLANSLRYHAIEKVSFLVYRSFGQLCANQCYSALRRALLRGPVHPSDPI
jgi:hypothetical protein